MQADTRRYAVQVPLSMQLGPAGLENFAQKHAEIFPAVRRLLRERGVTEAHAFLFQPPAVPKPVLCLTMTMPIELEAREALPEMLKEERQSQQWEQLVAAMHDAGQSKGNPWWATIAPELGLSSLAE
jgi:L-rhamnose mutarotase